MLRGTLLFFLLLPFWSPAQTMYISEPLPIRNDYGYELIGRLRDRILIFRDKYDDFEVQAYDQQMRPVWAKELQDLDKRGVQILAVTAGKNDFSVVYSRRQKGRVQLRLHKYDPTASLIDTFTIKDYGERIFNVPRLMHLMSEDRNCMAVYNEEESGKFEITCFRIDKMLVLWDRVLDKARVDTDINADEKVLTNEGVLFLIEEKNNRRNRIEEHQFSITTVRAGQELTFVSIPVPQMLTSDVLFRYDGVNQRLVGAGLYGERHRERVNGVFTFFYFPRTASFQTEQPQPFDEQFLSVLRQKSVEDDGKGILDTRMAYLLLRQDGGVVLVAERYRETLRGAVTNRGFWRDGSRAVVDYYYDDLFVITTHPDGKVHWKTVLHKKQYSQDDEGTFSSCFPFLSADKLRFLFNDEIKYENTCSEYVVSPLGDFDRNNLLNTEGQALRLRFRDACQLSNAECLVPSEFRNKLRFVLLRF
jgi:hypothetical protein